MYVQVAVMQAEIAAKQKECESDLVKAEPSLTAALAALDTLNKVHHFFYRTKFYSMKKIWNV